MKCVRVLNNSGPPPEPTCWKRIWRHVVAAFNALLFCASRWAFASYYAKSGRRGLPPLKDETLALPAMTLAERIRTGKLKSEDLIKSYIKRIQEFNPIVNCFVEDRFKDALKEGKDADDLIASGKMTVEQLAKEKPLLGVPFTTKDCIMVKDLHHTAGLVSRKDVIGTEDSESIAHLRKAGAIPLGLTNVSELCMWWESHNHVHGRSNNPYDTTRIVGGSSGGEGCMQASVGSAFGIGSDIGGSIRMPAFFNGIFGHKPSKFIVSNHGQYPFPVNKFQSSFLGLGPMTRKASDLKPLLKIISGANSSMLNLEENANVSSIKVYFQRNCVNERDINPVDPAIKSSLLKAVDHMKTVCKTEPSEVKFEKFSIGSKIWFASMNIKESQSFMQRLTGVDSAFNIFYEIIKSAFGKSDHTFIALMTALIEKAYPAPGSKEHDRLLKLRKDLEDEFIELLGDDGVFLYPTHPTAAPYHNEPLMRIFNFSYTGIVNVLGLPATHIPMGLDEDGLPVGIQVVSNWNNDRLCLAVAEELDKAFGGWVEPSGSKKQD